MISGKIGLKQISSFDKTQNCYAHVIQPVNYDQILKISQIPIIAQGSRLSYCNASSSSSGLSVNMFSFNKILHFDEVFGIIKMESGVTIGDLNSVAVGKNWTLPVLPGYPSITIGGCVAFNVHGKSQYKIGTFLDWILELTLFHPSYGEIKCSRTENEEIFNLTIGGMGLTGIILSVSMRLRKINGNLVEILRLNSSSIYDAVKLMQERTDQWDYVYSWNNLNLKGDSFGRGFVYLEKHIDKSLTYKVKAYKNRLLNSGKFPNLHSSLSINLMNNVYGIIENIKPTLTFSNIHESAFPIYGKEIYYYLFGKRGFREYQILFPFNSWESAIEEIKKLIQKKQMPIALGSMKLFSGVAHNLSFSGEGVCITIDVPNNSKSIAFLNLLDEITINYQGIINLSKDSRADYDLISKIFPQYYLFKQRINAFDPQKMFFSDLRIRLKI